jgi:hypothetical protein
MAPWAPDDFPRLTIDFERGDSPDIHCISYPDKLEKTFMTPHPKIKDRGRYEVGCSIIVLPGTFEEYLQSIGKKRRYKVRHAQSLGYSSAAIDRNVFRDDIFAINTSQDVRQGRQMSEAYRREITPYTPIPPHPCPRHQYRTYGVLRDGHLYAYVWVYQVGELWWLSTLLGHWDHLKDGIMFLLLTEAIRDLMEESPPRYAMYSEHFSGTEGLRFFKEQLGFKPYTVRWVN